MTKAKAIKTFCFDCAGETTKEVTLCHIRTCPLWEYRTGSHVSSSVYKRRMAAAERKYRDEIKEFDFGISDQKEMGRFPNFQAVETPTEREN